MPTHRFWCGYLAASALLASTLSAGAQVPPPWIDRGEGCNPVGKVWNCPHHITGKPTLCKCFPKGKGSARDRAIKEEIMRKMRARHGVPEPVRTTQRSGYRADPARNNPPRGDLPPMIGSPAPSTQPPSPATPANPSEKVLGEASPGSPFTLKDVKADKDFHIVTSDGLKLSAQQATQLPIDNSAIAVTGKTGATITLPDGKPFFIPPNSKVALGGAMVNIEKTKTIELRPKPFEQPQSKEEKDSKEGKDSQQQQVAKQPGDLQKCIKQLPSYFNAAPGIEGMGPACDAAQRTLYENLQAALKLTKDDNVLRPFVRDQLGTFFRAAESVPNQPGRLDSDTPGNQCKIVSRLRQEVQNCLGF